MEKDTIENSLEQQFEEIDPSMSISKEKIADQTDKKSAKNQDTKPDNPSENKVDKKNTALYIKPAGVSHPKTQIWRI